MSLFEFKLKDLRDVLPWGEGPDQYLHWFGLTDGIYFLNVGNDQLFRASELILRYWSKQCNSIDLDQPYVDYQVVRLYEDLLDILPDVLDPVPAVVNTLIETSSAQMNWRSGFGWYFEADENDELDDLYSQATEWWSFRKLSTLHLTQGPDIWFWRINDTIRIRWDNKQKDIDGIQPWTAISGQYDFTLAVFMQEVESFHSRLMNEMSNRIDVLLKDNPIPDINIDFHGLTKEHDERKTSLESALKRGPQKTDWDQVLKSNEKLRELNTL
jgi:hypothetical protein